LVENNKMG